MNACIIGSRGHIWYVFESLPELPQLKVTGMSTGSSQDTLDKLFSFTSDAGISPTQYDDWQTMLDTEKPTVVAIDGPFERHAEMCIAALNRNIHVFCEKPIALTLADLDNIENAWRNSNAKIISMVGLRYDAAFYQARTMVKQGVIGDIRLVSAQKSYKLGHRPAFYQDRATYGGTIPWVGSHAFDWVFWFTGANLQSVTAYHTAIGNELNGTMEIAAQCQLMLDNGVFAQCSIDVLRPDCAATHGDDRIRLVGSRGILEVVEGKIHLLTENEDKVISPSPCPRKIFSDFIAEIEGGRKCLVTAEETFQLTRAVLQARDIADSLSKKTTIH